MCLMFDFTSYSPRRWLSTARCCEICTSLSRKWLPESHIFLSLSVDTVSHTVHSVFMEWKGVIVLYKFHARRGPYIHVYFNHKWTLQNIGYYYQVFWCSKLTRTAELSRYLKKTPEMQQFLSIKTPTDIACN